MGHGIDDLKMIFIIGSKEVQPIAESLASKISVPVQAVNPFGSIQVAQSVSQSEEIRLTPEIFTSAVGMAIKKAPKIISQARK